MTYLLWLLIAALFGLGAAAPTMAEVDPVPPASIATPTGLPTSSADVGSD